MNILNSHGFQLMERTLDASSLRQKVIANNIANVDTPYFKRSEVKFEELLQQQTGGRLVGYRTDPRHFYIPSGSNQKLQPQIVQDGNSMINNNLNNVDIDYEMSLMAKNQLRYNVIAQQVSNDIKHTRIAIDGRA